MILAAVIQYVDGNQTIIHVSELIGDDNDSITSGEDDNSHICCVYGNCSCNSIDHALANITSNVLINITTDVMLSSIVRASDLENVSIIGHNNPTVNCKHVGGIHFTFCNNCIIQGITWDEYGTKNIAKPGLKFSYSFNVTIKNCCFQDSVAQAVVLSDVSGDVNFTHCEFINNHYRGHGAVIHYSSNNTRNSSPLVLTINNCSFSYNSMKSLVYIEGNLFKYNKLKIFNTTFFGNQGTSVYAIKHNIYFNGEVLFQNNTAENGAGIYISDYSTVIFDKNSDITFIQNIADCNGGAIFLEIHSICLFDQNSMVTFKDNKATNGIVYSQSNSNVAFKATCKVKFTDNSAHRGAAIYIDSAYNTHVAISGYYSRISFEGNSTTVFSNNIAAIHGGAIYSYFNTYISFKGNSTTVFSNNIAGYGGAIYSFFNSSISFKGNSTTVFNGNNAGQGGAIRCIGGGQISFKEISTALFSNNTADYGGAIYFTLESTLSFEGNSTTLFSDNTGEYGGAILARDYCSITSDDNSTVAFNNNNATFGATVFTNRNCEVIVKGHSSVLFNDLTPKWCDKVCLSYDEQGDALTIDSEGIVWCSEQIVFRYISNKCKEINIKGNLVNISDKLTTLSTMLYVQTDIAIIGHNNPTVLCGHYGGLSLQANKDSNLIIEGITWIGCGYARNAESFEVMGAISISGYRNVTIHNCSFQHSIGQVINLQDVQHVNIYNCEFVNSSPYTGHGAAIFSSLQNKFYLFTIQNCYFSSNKNAKSIIYFECSNDKHDIYLINSSFHNNQGVSIYLSSYSNVHINGEVLFENNVAKNGAGIYISDHSTVTFGENSKTKFITNTVRHNGAAIFLNDHSSLLFDNNSIVTFADNRATNGTIYSMDSSIVKFKATSKVTFNKNSATQYGSAIYSSDNSHMTFIGNSSVNFTNNVIFSNAMDLPVGGTVFSENNGNISFEENSSITFLNNIADFGTAILSINAHVVFKDRSTVMIDNNKAHYCGVVPSSLLSVFTNVYTANTASHTSSNHGSSAGAICALHKSKIRFSGHSLVTFINNTASGGGAVVSSESIVIIEEYATVTFNNNFAQSSSGGALVCSNNGDVTIKGNSNVIFNGNKASQDGGAIYSYNMCNITFRDNSTSSFINNTAKNNGGVILSNHYSDISFEGNSAVIFDYNTADNGGTFYITNSSIMFKETSNVSFHNNHARQSFGVGYFSLSSKVIFDDNTTVRFVKNTAQNAGMLYITNSKIWFNGNSTVTLAYNRATLNCGALCLDSSSDASFSEFTNVTFHHNRAFYGGAILANDHCNITLTGNSDLLFAHNEATQSGGAGYFNYSCNFIMQDNALATFDNNRALHGGAVCIRNKTEILFERNSTALFCNNVATVGGGAINVLTDSSIILKYHTALKCIHNNAQYGGAIFLDTCAIMVNNGDKKHMNFTKNFAKVLGSSVYQEVTELCNSNCVINRTVGVSYKYIATPPNQLKLYDPAICIDNDNDTQCNSYYVKNVMLGTEIVIPACVLDYYNQSIDSTQFLVLDEAHSNYFNSGPKDVLISGSKFEGINIIGNQTLSESTNFSINITLNIALNSDWKQISVNLIIELKPCHPGFWQYPDSKTCECYNADDIVFCSGSNSTIKRGYWFGSVTGKPTVTFCPINYCNFTCCETSNGYYQLSPVRDNQCRSHRSGTACGSCEEGYTLSFDSVECINVQECSTGQTILVLTLILLYWIVIIAAVFSMMHFKVGIGYLYAITYYYSVLDLLLSQNLSPSNVLYTTINVMSSVAKIIPQFLGKFCFITNMSGIDQQFIHYIHPVAISLFLVMITVLARRSRRLSSFISKEIIHVICCLLLLSYTSLAATSLLLMRPLIFHKVDKVYTYVSPDVQYFHGRHLAYAIVALVFTIVIVIGLPLVLALEPFLNSKINFVKVKPLLDQFQGCYKDKYRYFAAYYMICRLVIITIVIVNSSDDSIFQYLLITACVMIDLIHQILRPYSSPLLNVFDGVVLHFLVLVSVLPLVESFDSFNSKLLVALTFIIVILPLLIFIAMSLMINKEKIKKLPGYCYIKLQLHLNKYNVIPIHETSAENEHVNIVDDSRRVNATICDV